MFTNYELLEMFIVLFVLLWVASLRIDLAWYPDKKVKYTPPKNAEADPRDWSGWSGGDE